MTVKEMMKELEKYPAQSKITCEVRMTKMARTMTI